MYLYPVGTGVVAVSSTLICITFKSLSNSVETLHETLKTGTGISGTQAKYINLIYLSFQLIIERLSYIFSTSLLFQELAFLLTIVFCINGGSKLAAVHSVILGIFVSNMSVSLCFLVTFQFYPMIKLHLNSERLLGLIKSLMVETKYTKVLARQYREIKVRPMRVHTVTVDTLCDYVVFVMSLVLMLFSIESSRDSPWLYC